jgi:polyhydroxybutyrate depolymerase
MPVHRLRRHIGLMPALLLLVFLLVLRAQSTAAAQPACGAPENACALAEGSYHVYQPAFLDGTTAPMPVLFYFHGYQGTGAGVIRTRALQDIADHYGFLLVAPNGRNKTWAHNGSPSQARDELAFVDAVIDDLIRDWHIAADRIYATGFSQGGSMVWDLICHRPDRFAGFAPVAGAFWEPHPTGCVASADNRENRDVPIIHFHGTGDTVVPMAGRPIGEYRQGDVARSMATLRATYQCQPAPTVSSALGTMTCEIWQGCAGAAKLQLCLHPGGHVRPDGWFDRVADFWRIAPVTDGDVAE